MPETSDLYTTGHRQRVWVSTAAARWRHVWQVITRPRMTSMFVLSSVVVAIIQRSSSLHTCTSFSWVQVQSMSPSHYAHSELDQNWALASWGWARSQTPRQNAVGFSHHFFVCLKDSTEIQASPGDDWLLLVEALCCCISSWRLVFFMRDGNVIWDCYAWASRFETSHQLNGDIVHRNPSCLYCYRELTIR